MQLHAHTFSLNRKKQELYIPKLLIPEGVCVRPPEDTLQETALPTRASDTEEDNLGWLAREKGGKGRAGTVR